MSEGIGIRWEGPASDEELVVLARVTGGRVEAGWWDRVRSHSLGWVTARTSDDRLVGFVNVAWDGGVHAFLLDTKVDPSHQRRGIATGLVEVATKGARDAGCEWLHVDFEEHLTSFYLDACGFRRTDAGLIHLA